MTFDRTQIQRLRFGVEATFGTDLTDDVASNFSDLRHMPTTPMRGTMVERDGTVRQRFYQDRGVVLGPDRGSIAVESYFEGLGTALVAGQSSTKTPQSLLLEAIMGGYASDEGDTVEASPTPTTTVFTVTDGTRFDRGQIISVAVSGVAYPCVISAIATNALTVWPALPSAPATAAIVYNSQTTYLDEAVETSLQFLWETAIDRGDIWLLLGCQGDLSFNLSAAGLLTFSTTQQAARYLHDDEITSPQGGSALAAATYTGSGPLFGTEGGMHFGVSGATTRSLVKPVDISITPSISQIDVPDPNGIGGLCGRAKGIPEMKLEMTLLKDASDGTYEIWHDAFKAGTEYGALWWAGSAGGNQVAIAMPTLEFDAAPEPADSNGLVAQKVSCIIKESTLSGATTTALERSPFVVASL